MGGRGLVRFQSKIRIPNSKIEGRYQRFVSINGTLIPKKEKDRRLNSNFAIKSDPIPVFNPKSAI
jgi:hypothetical protein